jgi:hypothetical protein
MSIDPSVPLQSRLIKQNVASTSSGPLFDAWGTYEESEDQTYHPRGPVADAIHRPSEIHANRIVAIPQFGPNFVDHRPSKTVGMLNIQHEMQPTVTGVAGAIRYQPYKTKAPIELTFPEREELLVRGNLNRAKQAWREVEHPQNSSAFNRTVTLPSFLPTQTLLPGEMRVFKNTMDKDAGMRMRIMTSAGKPDDGVLDYPEAPPSRPMLATRNNAGPTLRARGLVDDMGVDGSAERSRMPMLQPQGSLARNMARGEYTMLVRKSPYGNEQYDHQASNYAPTPIFAKQIDPKKQMLDNSARIHGPAHGILASGDTDYNTELLTQAVENRITLSGNKRLSRANVGNADRSHAYGPANDTDDHHELAIAQFTRHVQQNQNGASLGTKRTRKMTHIDQRQALLHDTTANTYDAQRQGSELSRQRMRTTHRRGVSYGRLLVNVPGGDRLDHSTHVSNEKYARQPAVRLNYGASVMR